MQQDVGSHHYNLAIVLGKATSGSLIKGVIRSGRNMLQPTVYLDGKHAQALKLLVDLSMSVDLYEVSWFSTLLSTQ